MESESHFSWCYLVYKLIIITEMTEHATVALTSGFKRIFMNYPVGSEERENVGEKIWQTMDRLKTV